MRGCKLKSTVNWQGLLQQKICKTDTKQGLPLYTFSFNIFDV